MAGPLEGIRVLECGGYLSAPSAGYMLGDLGAEVIKIERPGTGELGRGLLKTPNFPLSPYFETNNRG